MRREMSPREIVDRNFRSLTKRCETLRGLARDQDERLQVELFEDSLKEVHALALSFTVESGPLDPEKLSRFIDSSDPAKLTAFIERHLRRQAPLLGIEGVNPGTLAEACLEQIIKIDPAGDFDEQLSKIGTALVDAYGISAKSWSAYMIETMCREALGIDGRVPDERDEGSLENASRLLEVISRKDATPSPV